MLIYNCPKQGARVRLTRLHINNHSRLVDFDIQIRDHLVIIGANDVGKSSLLRCLNLLLGSSTAQLYAQLGAEDLRKADQPLVIEVEAADFTATDKALFPDEIMVNPTTNELKLTIRLTVTVDSNQTVSIERTAPGTGTARQLSREQFVGLGWKFLNATEQGRDLREKRRSVLDSILERVDLGAEQSDFDAIANSLSKQLMDSKVLNGLRGELANQLSKALPQALAMDDLRFVPNATAGDDVLNDVRLQVTSGGKTRNIAEQSDGIRALYAIALYDLLSAGSNVVGIDEPEIHLHPTSQRSLARLLKGTPNQKIMATHSADIVAAFNPDSIVVVRTGGLVTQPSAGFLSDDERMRVRWWVRNRLEPLTSRRVVGVEGISDRIILERIAELTKRNLDRLGISVIETDGAGDMGALEKLFGKKGFNVPVSMLIDEDAEKTTAEQLGIGVSDLNLHSVWVSRPDIEGEYVSACGALTVWTALTASGLFSPNELALCIGSGPGGLRTDKDVASFCRRGSKYKVRAALAVAPVLSATTAVLVVSVHAALDAISKS